jgi:hypothetical protein
MRAPTAPLGIAAAVAFSTAASALPCAEAPIATSPLASVACADDSDRPGAVFAVEGGGREPTATVDPLGENTAVAGVEPAELGEFAERVVKITNLEATMTANKYVAGRIPPVPQTSPIEDLTMYAPDYLSVKLLPRLPKRKSVGVGLVTLPKPSLKKSDTFPGADGPPAKSIP